MTSRGLVAVLMLLSGIALAAVSYLFLAAPLGPPSGQVYSNPRLVGAPAIFVFGVMLVFLAAVVYELLPEKQAR